MTQNAFIWFELATDDVAAAQEFYSHVVGWRAAPFHEGADYTILHAGDVGVGGLMVLPEQAKVNGARPRWSHYLHVDDVDAEATKVEADGGTLFFGPEDIPQVGRFAMLGDPQGAHYMIMAPLPRPAPEPVPFGTPGHVGWRELHTTDNVAAFTFYAKHYGWGAGDVLDMGPMGSYRIFTLDGAMAGGMMVSPDMPRPLWLLYFSVPEIVAAKDRIEAAGGTVLFGPSEVPGGAFVVQARDPQGAMFAVTGPKGG